MSSAAAWRAGVDAVMLSTFHGLAIAAIVGHRGIPSQAVPGPWGHAPRAPTPIRSLFAMPEIRLDPWQDRFSEAVFFHDLPN